MKRASALRYLHMGCGEGLFARRPLAAVRPAKRDDALRGQPAVLKKSGGRR